VGRPALPGARGDPLADSLHQCQTLWQRLDTVAAPVVPVLPDELSLVPLAEPDCADEVVTGLAVAEPVFPPLPELPEVGLEFTVAGPVVPVDPVFPELPDWASELVRGPVLTRR